MGDLALYYAKKGDAHNALQYITQARSIDANDNYLMYSEALVRTMGVSLRTRSNR